MEAYERDVIVYEMFLGYKEYRVKEGLILRVHRPSLQQIYKSQLVYRETYRDALVKNNLTTQESVELLKAEGVWSSEKEKILEQIPKKAEELKIKIFKNFRRNAVREGYRQELRNLEKEFLDLSQEKSQYQYVTCEGLATYARMMWVTENTVTFEDGQPYDWNEVGIVGLMNYFSQKQLSEKEIREIARNEPWKSTWSCSGKNSEELFGVKANELTFEEKNLIGWSRLYDNIQESPECPREDVINDDDAFDGWLISENRKRDKDKQQKSLEEELPDKIKDSEEVFIAATTQEEIDEIHDLNSEQAKWNIKARHKVISDANEKGSLAHDLDFMDVRTKIAQEQKGIP